MLNDLDRARDALAAIPADLPREEWVRVAMSAKAAGLALADFDQWSATAPDRYNATACRDTWKSINGTGGIGAGTLFRLAAEYGWQDRPGNDRPRRPPPRVEPPQVRPPQEDHPGAVSIWKRCPPAPEDHPYILAKGGTPDGLRVVPEANPLAIAGQRLAGALVVPAYAGGKLQSLQFIPASGMGKKLNLAGASMAGASFTLGEVKPGRPCYLTEGIGQAWACHAATGEAAVCCFGWGNVKTIAASLAGPPGPALVVVPDVGKEPQAIELAREVGAAVACLPGGLPPNYDVNDFALAEGAEALRTLLEAARAPAAADWGPLEPLPVTLPPVAPFALELLPVALRPWVRDIADRMQCPPDYPAVAAVVALAAVVGRQVGIRPKERDDWLVVPNLWGAVVGRPALLKTPAVAEPMKMIAALEAAAGEEFARMAQEYNAEALIREAEDKAARADIAKAVKDGDRARAAAIAMEASQEAEAPVRRRYLTQDATVEKLGELLRENPRGILVFRDELVGFLKTLDQEGREGARAFYLESWNGTGRFTFDRIGRGTVEIPAACVSIIGAIQPGPLRDYIAGAIAGGAGDDGLMQRFQLAVWPDPSREWFNVDRWPDSAAKREAREVFERLDAIDPAAIGAAQEGEDGIPFLRFTADAQARFNRWREELEARLRADDLHPAMEAHLAKFRSLVPSLALLSHLADNPEGGPVGLPSLVRALAWAEYLETHADRVYAPAIQSDLFAAGELVKRLASLPAPFTARDVYRRHWRGLTQDGTRVAIEVLLDYNHLREVPQEARGAGRQTARYEVHPDLIGGPA